MNKCYIYGALPFEKVYSLPADGNFVIAADGGLDTVKKLGIMPDLIIGDFDSLGYVPDEKNTVRLPVRKDDTDVGYAVKTAYDMGFRDFEIYGAIGGKIDHSIANIQIAAAISKKGGNVRFYGDGICVTAVTDSSLFIGGKGRLSVFAFGGNAENVSISGSEYDVENISLTPFFPLGVSNAFKGDTVKIAVGKGTLVITYEI